MKTLEFKPYLFEPLRSMKKISTIRKSDKGLKKDDLVECVFEGTTFSIYRIVESVEQFKFEELDHAHATNYHMIKVKNHAEWQLKPFLKSIFHYN